MRESSAGSSSSPSYSSSRSSGSSGYRRLFDPTQDLKALRRIRADNARIRAENRRKQAEYRRRQAEYRRKQEVARRQAKYRRRQEGARTQADARRRQEVARRQADARRRQEVARRQAEARGRQEVARRQAEARRQEQARIQAEARRRRQEQARRQRADRASRAAQAAHCLQTRRLKGGFNVSDVEIGNRCNYAIEVGGACVGTSFKANYPYKGTYSPYESMGLTTLHPNRWEPAVALEMCNKKGRTARSIACRTPFTPYFTSPNGSSYGCFEFREMLKRSAR